MNLIIQSLHLGRQRPKPILLNLGRGKVYRELHCPVELPVHTPQAIQHPRYEGITRSYGANDVCQHCRSRTVVIPTVTKRCMPREMAECDNRATRRSHTQQGGRLSRFAAQWRQDVRLLGCADLLCEWRRLHERPMCTTSGIWICRRRTLSVNGDVTLGSLDSGLVEGAATVTTTTPINISSPPTERGWTQKKCYPYLIDASSPIRQALPVM